MKRHARQLQFGLATVAMLGLAAGSMLADDCVERPFELVISSVEVIDVQGNSFTVVGSGQASHMGAVTFVNEVSQFGHRAQALRTVEAADGDLLFMYHETEFDEVLGRYVGTYEILDGTGKFENASGSGIQIQGIGSSGTICY